MLLAVVGAAVAQIQEQVQERVQVRVVALLISFLVWAVLQFPQELLRAERCWLQVVKSFSLKRSRIRERGWASGLQL